MHRIGMQQTRGAHPGHILTLDGIRGSAILLVMVFHLARWQTTPVGVDAFLDRLRASGWIGVDLFFVLSGFLITGILCDAKDSSGFFRAFYARRVLRIFPLYYAFLAFLAFLLPWLAPGIPGLREWLKVQEWWWLYLSNIYVALHGWTYLTGIAGHFWSLAIEEQFYLVWPVVVLLSPRRRLPIVCIVCILLAPLCRLVLVLTDADPLAPYVLMPARMDALAMGGLLAAVVRSPVPSATVARAARIPGVGAAAVIAGLWLSRSGLYYGDRWVQTLGFSALAVFFGWILIASVAAPPGSRLQSALTAPVLRMFGRYSYGLYVVHWPVSTVLHHSVLPHLRFARILGSAAIEPAIALVLGITISLLIAVGSWHLLEKHFIRMKSLFPSSPGDRSAQSGPPTPRRPC
jgi:peptidoglycan/LPS O-acetylase OafA/YrhL